MKKQPDQDRKAEASGKTSGRVGAKEVLTQELARRIALMVSQFPDANIAVTWDNVVQQTKLRFGREFQRNVLSQKAWGGRKLVAEAFKDAKAIQSRQARDAVPKYANAPRSRLRLVVAKLQAENLALREQLDRVRALQYDEIHALLDTRTPLNRLVASRSAAPASEGATESAPRSSGVFSIQDAKTGRTVEDFGKGPSEGG